MEVLAPHLGTLDGVARVPIDVLLLLTWPSSVAVWQTFNPGLKYKAILFFSIGFPSKIGLFETDLIFVEKYFLEI